MDHQEIEELISAHADGELTPAQREALDLHLAACSDCQRNLAEFRLTRQQLALLADPGALTWRPDVAQSVTERVRRRQRWLGLGRRLALDTARALAAVSLVVALVWLLPRLLTVAPDDAGYVAAPSLVPQTGEPVASTITLGPIAPTPASNQFTPVPPEPTGQPDADEVFLLQVPGYRYRLELWNASLLPYTLADNALQNWGFQFFMDNEVPLQDVFIVLEQPDGSQTLLDPARAPSIPVPDGSQVGDALRLFLWLRGRDHSPVAEFTLGQDANGDWLAADLRLSDATPSIQHTFLQYSIISDTQFNLSIPRRGVRLVVISGAETTPYIPNSDNTTRLEMDELADVDTGDIFAVLERSDGTQEAWSTMITMRQLNAIKPGERVRLFLWLRDGDYSPTVEFGLDYDDQGNWVFVEPQQLNVTPELRVALPQVQVQTVTSPPSSVVLHSHDWQFALYLFDNSLLQKAPAPDALLNWGYRLTSEAPATSVLIEVVGGEQILLDLEQAPSIYLPPSAQPGDLLRIFAATPAGVTTPAAEFTLSPTRTLALNMHQTTAPRIVRVELPDLSPIVNLKAGLALNLVEISLDPAQPRPGESFDIIAVIRNEGRVDTSTPLWFNLYQGEYITRTDSKSSNLILSSSTPPINIPSGQEIEFAWNVGSGWGEGYDWHSISHLDLLAGINVAQPQGSYYRALSPEDDTSDNVVEVEIELAPYEPQVRNVCPPGDNLWLDLGQPESGYSQFPEPESELHLVIHNDSNTDISTVPLRLTDALGHTSLAYVRWTVPACGGVLNLHLDPPSPQPLYPITATLNPPDVFDATPESDYSDNVIVITNPDLPCQGPADVWLEDEDVILDGDDLLITLHFSGSPPSKSFWLYVYHSQDGRTIVAKQITMTTCVEQQTYRFEGVMAGLSGGFLMLQIDTAQNHAEGSYPQSNNSATVPLP
jgi:hypothetical protein